MPFHFLAEITKDLNRPVVYISDLQLRLELPAAEDAGYSDALQAFLQTLIHLRKLVIAGDRLRELWDIERKFIQLANAEANRTPKRNSTLSSTLSPFHRALDQAVLTAYACHQPGPNGPAIILGHDFQEVETLPENDRTRYTITPQARKDLLTRLLKLIHHRAAEESSTSNTRLIEPAPLRKAQRGRSEDELI